MTVCVTCRAYCLVRSTHEEKGEAVPGLYGDGIAFRRWLLGAEAKPLVYEIGPTMVELMLQQKAYEGASPAELEGMRQGIELQLSESPISITLVDDHTLKVVANEEEQELQYRKEGLRLKAQNQETGEYLDLGFFSKDGKKLTMINGAILDLAK